MKMILEKVYDELMAQIEDLKKAVASTSGGADEYDDLRNRPKVNNITLTGNKKSSDLKIAYSMTEAEYAAASKNAESIYCLQENASTLTDSAYVNLEVADWTEESGVYKQTQPFVFEITPAPGWSVEDVSIETGIASVDSYEVTSNPLGLSITYAAETLPEYGITATVTVTVSQPIGATRFVKDGIEFKGTYRKSLYTADAYSASFELSDPLNSYDELYIEASYNVQSVRYTISGNVRSEILTGAVKYGIGLSNYSYIIIGKGEDNSHIVVLSRSENGIYISRVIGIKY